MPLTELAAIRSALAAHAAPEHAAALQRFFRTGPGEYAEGDRFIGVRVPATRRVARECGALGDETILALLRSDIHEERLLALLLLVRDFKRGDSTRRGALWRLYRANTGHINNWDLVDASAEHIVGGWLETRSRTPLFRLARSRSLWERRIAIMATFHFLKRGESRDTIAIATQLLDDPHDLIHKATGWMLREMGARCGAETLEAFLRTHGARMPRTMLRYAIEHFPEAKRRRYLLGTRSQRGAAG